MNHLQARIDDHGRQRCEVASGSKKSLGQYFTPLTVAEFMAEQVVASTVGKVKVSVLDPGCGCGMLALTMCKALIEGHPDLRTVLCTLYEIDDTLAAFLQTVFESAQGLAATKGVDLQFVLKQDDFVAGALRDEGGYDIIISNPPYFKLGAQHPAAVATRGVVEGQANMYTLFMSLGTKLLAPGGRLVYLVPRSFASGSYFRKFRQQFFEKTALETVHLFDSRTEAFEKDNVLQENVIICCCKGDPPEQVYLSFSRGTRDLSGRVVFPCRLQHVLHQIQADAPIIRLPRDEEELKTLLFFDSLPESLASLGLRVGTGPVMPFRCEQHLARKGGAPLFWMQHVTFMRLTWPLPTLAKRQNMKLSAPQKLFMPSQNMVFVRRFSAKEQDRRIVAAAYLHHQWNHAQVGLENHINYIASKPGAGMGPLLAQGLAAFLNWQKTDAYFRTFSGNTQVSACELSLLPLPSMEVLEAIGQEVTLLSSLSKVSEADSAVEFVLSRWSKEGGRRLAK